MILRIPEPETPLYVAVGHTASSKENTGIQRVTRSFTRSALEFTSRIVLVEWRQKAKSLFILSDPMRQQLSEYGGPPNAMNFVAPPHPPKWISYLPIPRKSRRSLREAFRERYRRRFRTLVLRPHEGAWLLVPELLTEEEMRGLISFARKLHLNLAFIFHDAIALLHPEWVNERIRKNHAGYMREMSNADIIFPVSRFSARCYEDFAKQESLPIPEMRVCSLASEFSDLPRVLHYDPPKTREISAVCLSTLDPRKNHLILLRAIEQARTEAPDLPLYVTFVGNSYEGAPEIAEAVVSACVRNPRLRWLGQVSDEDLARVYQKSHFSIFPSLVEGFGLPILESIWNARPCVCSNQGVMGELAKDSGCYTVDTRDYRKLAKALIRMATDHDLRNCLAEQCVARRPRTWREYSSEVISRLRA